MEIYTIDPLTYKKVTVVDQYESLLWVERYSDLGDFKLVVIDTPSNRSLFRDGAMLVNNLTDRVMVVENRLRKTDAAGVMRLTVSGQSFEAILKNRAVAPNVSDNTTWNANGSYGWLASRLAGSVLVNGNGLMSEDIIPSMYYGFTSPDTNPVDIAVELGSLYDGVKKICDSGKLGFRIQLITLEGVLRLRFNVYQGRDLRHVIFSSTLDSLAEESHLHDISNYKNIAYVWGKDKKKSVVVAAPGLSVYRTGWMRKVMHVDAGDIDPAKVTPEIYENQLRQRGVEQLASQNKVDIFDAELTSVDPYDYRYSYSLGDVVTMMDADNNRHTAIITEYIWSIDSEGLRSYPTFVATDEWD